MNLGIARQVHHQEVRYGISIGKSWVKTRKSFDKITFLTFNAGMQPVNLGVGFGSIKHRWGYSKRNKCKTFGTILEGNIIAPSEIGLLVGFQRFKYSNASWAWFNEPYNTIYFGAGARMQPLLITM